MIYWWENIRENADLLIICGGIFGAIVDQLWRWVICGYDYDIDKLLHGCGQYVDFLPIFCPHFLCPSKRKEHPIFPVRDSAALWRRGCGREVRGGARRQQQDHALLLGGDSIEKILAQVGFKNGFIFHFDSETCLNYPFLDIFLV